jgi:hypothetical protein
LPAPPLASGTQGKAGGIVRDALTLEPLEGVTVRVEGVDGAVLSDDAGNFMLPVVNFGDETAVSEVLVYEAPGYIPAYRRVIAYPDVPVTADPVFLKKYDSKTTPIGPAGGTATSAAGDVEADFPAGASSGTMAVQLTNYSAGRELPGPLPRASAFTYAVDLAPNGAAFSSPVTVRIANTLGFAPHTPVPVGVFNPETARWEPESMASISADGQWVVFQVTHFSGYSRILVGLRGSGDGGPRTTCGRTGLRLRLWRQTAMKERSEGSRGLKGEFGAGSVGAWQIRRSRTGARKRR